MYSSLPLRRPPCPYFGSEVYEAERAFAWCCGKPSLNSPSLLDLWKTTGRSTAVEEDELPVTEPYRSLEQSPPVKGSRHHELFAHLATTKAGEARPDRLSEWFLLPSRDRGMGDRPTLVLDLDETLISSSEGFASEFEMESVQAPEKVRVFRNFETPSPHQGAFRLVWNDGCLEVRPRPGLSRFLAFVRKHFEVILWTAGTAEYAKAILSVIDPTGEIFAGRLVARDKRWFRPQPDGQGYAKDLRRLGRSLQRTVLVDNSPAVCRRNPENCVVIPDWVGQKHGKSDRALLELLRVLTAWLASRQPAGTFLASCENLLRASVDVPGHSIETDLYHLVERPDAEQHHAKHIAHTDTPQLPSKI